MGGSHSLILSFCKNNDDSNNDGTNDVNNYNNNSSNYNINNDGNSTPHDDETNNVISSKEAINRKMQ